MNIDLRLQTQKPEQKSEERKKKKKTKKAKNFINLTNNPCNGMEYSFSLN